MFTSIVAVIAISSRPDPQASYSPVSKSDVSAVSAKYPALTKAFASGKAENVIAFFSPTATFRGYFRAQNGKVLTGNQPFATYKTSVEMQMKGALPPKHDYAIEIVSMKGDLIEARVWVHSIVYFQERSLSGVPGSAEGYGGLIHTWRKMGGQLVISDEKNAEVGYEESAIKFKKFGGR